MLNIPKCLFRCFCFFKKSKHPYSNINTTIDHNLTNHSSSITSSLITPLTPTLTPILWKDTVPFIPPIQGGQVIKVYDGDTLTIAVKMPYENSPLYRFPVRFRGIDTPEIHGKDEDEKQSAIFARDAVSNMTLHKYVTLKNIGNEKYGRLLADVYLDDIHINEWLLKERYAVPYDGGIKNSPNSWIKYRITGEY